MEICSLLQDLAQTRAWSETQPSPWCYRAKEGADAGILRFISHLFAFSRTNSCKKNTFRRVKQGTKNPLINGKYVLVKQIFRLGPLT
ncbi:MAG: hypothetical protein PeribacterA2_1125 [Candidatus Peribacter riflensis]|uniref:Uncharacterized protein n=1 Tax=Candidatus Peribacter riflensis TaxID=1735162 RepID=A0A0S1STG3_9BACT|nr:MAG: hypothetical protein PeribacterA2_1125 [Candidatus Peribacter riflensis]ALM11582.1 MAG: hypothetical protein PeribacterB2_1127 [Candidatus Peribacter riflensis]ALM12684.1 MAG: hypothetical protein PeribacterC2_1126 [Candidatus Peribacter riflensis]ALM13785.1 MAG: hypothetical protein PeribacterD1_1125 [Candidatus Peribacter riflensis]ALM14888.1 MAG: hypothetical protein PeribacterD2_1127 [Candidatus Peribacter riflensis]